jgi:hypothetical protein
MLFNPHKLGVHKVLQHIPLNALFDIPYKAALKKAVNIADLRTIAKSRSHKVRYVTDRSSLNCMYGPALALHFTHDKHTHTHTQNIDWVGLFLSFFLSLSLSLSLSKTRPTYNDSLLSFHFLLFLPLLIHPSSSFYFIIQNK